MHKVLAALLGLALAMAAGGCAKDDDGPVKPDYTPVADVELVQQIEAIPGVTDVQVKFRKSFTYGTEYHGPITVAEGIDAAAVLDRVYAILRQGRPGVGITVRAVQGGRQVSSDAFGLAVGTPPRLEERYGPQPGDGKPPAADE